jgi:tetratricopeptide (TPR) repeat protein
MKRTSIVLFAALLFAGCGGEKKEAAKESAPETAKKTAPQLQIVDEVEPLTDELTALNKKVEKLSTLASQQQSAFDFGNAAKTWDQVQQVLAQQFGEDSWQVTNARLAAKTARIEAGFSPEQTEQLKSIFEKQQSVGQSLRNSDIETALRLSVESSQVTEKLFGSDSFMMGKQLMQLSRMYQQIGRMDLAATEFQHAADILTQYLGDIHPDLEVCHAYLGEVFMTKGDTYTAISHHSQATEISRRVWGEGTLRFAARCNDLGAAYHKNKQHEPAIKTLQIAEAIRRVRLNDRHPQVAHSLTNLGVVYLDMNDKLKAESCLDEAHAIFKTHYGESHGLTADAKSKLATVKMLVQKFGDAERLLGQLINLVQDNSNPIAIATLQYRLAIALSRQGKYPRAEPLFQSALALQRENFGNNHQATVATMKAYALLLKQSNRDDQAQQIYTQIDRIAQQPVADSLR